LWRLEDDSTARKGIPVSERFSVVVGDIVSLPGGHAALLLIVVHDSVGVPTLGRFLGAGGSGRLDVEDGVAKDDLHFLRRQRRE
jgi:hypothetical protein